MKEQNEVVTEVAENAKEEASKLEVVGLSKAYGDTMVLSDVTLTFQKGHCYGLFGENGAGKSTFYRIMAGRTTADAGKITIDGKDIFMDSEKRSKVFCSGDGMYFPENLSTGKILQVMSMLQNGFDYEYAEALMLRFGISDKSRFGKLSRGETSLFCDILALASSADFIILDEPVLGVDVNKRVLFYEELTRLVAKEEKAYIITTHLIDEVTDLIEYAIILSYGTVVLNGSMDTIEGQYLMVSGMNRSVIESTASCKVLREEKIGSFLCRIVERPEKKVNFEGFGVEVTGAPFEKVFSALSGGWKLVKRRG